MKATLPYTVSSVPPDRWLVSPDDVFNQLTVIGEPFYRCSEKYSARQYVLVRCVCGLEKEVACVGLREGRPRACGKSCKGSESNRLNDLKKCTQCKRFLPRKAFGSNKAKKDGLKTECLRCSATRNLAQYNITLAEYDLMYEGQKGLCAICEQKDESIKDERWQSLYVDHDHVSGRVRGLLCHNCNVALGLMRDNPEVLRAAVVYLEERS